MLLDFIHWNVDPEALSLGFIHIRWYGVLFATGFILCYYAFRELLKFDRFQTEDVDNILMYIIIGTIVGARLGECLFYNFDYYRQNPIEILYIWRGGLASHGAAVGIFTAIYLFSLKVKRPFLWLLDRVVIVIGLGGAFIRIGNLMNSEIYGHETALPWGFIFERNGEVVPKHPTQIYEALFYLLLYVFLRWLYRTNKNLPNPGLIFGSFLVLLFGFRFVVEFIKNVQEAFESGMPLHMGQILSIPFILAGVLFLLYSLFSRPDPTSLQQAKK